MSAQAQEMRQTVDQLKQEASVERLPVSKAIQEMLLFMDQNANTDCLVSGMIQADNPFRDPKGCVIL